MSEILNGILVIDKPQNMTSHDVVAILRRKLKTKKIGHTGTLDPMATGVLPVCIGRATKVVDYLSDRKKGYACDMVLGASTDTQDQWGEILFKGDYSEISAEEIELAVGSFIGEIDQIPPMYSALKVNGLKLVDLARKGIVVEREARKRTIFEIRELKIDIPTIHFEVICSKGTYIRTLCHDIGEKLGCYGHMTGLNRICSEPFDLSKAFKLEEISLSTIESQLLPIDSALTWMTPIFLPDQNKLRNQLGNGVKIDLSKFAQETADEFRVYIGSDFYGIAEKSSTGIFMKKLIIG